MRHTKEHKDATRQRILESAGRLFKGGGIDGTGIAALMADASLTNGAFYKHFASKDDLVAHTLTAQLDVQQQAVDSLPQGRSGIEEFVRHYLSTEHRDDLSHGCPSAALLDEIGRCSTDAKQAYTDGLTALMDALGARLSPTDPEAARPTVLTAFAMMAGTLQVSRALADPVLADELLRRAAAEALNLLNATAD
ncbi:TetR/AcrR family transcriptional regulator [Streptomyces sp. NPDC059629]|uniref:TetR/AcrR family transcriptional regulator n=1 Tax=Streptomyces sp. NPDC059629 TaxID=3346889 RepID=UPI00367B335E